MRNLAHPSVLILGAFEYQGQKCSAASDAEVLCGGYNDTRGYFVEPTMIQAKLPGYRSMVEEIF